MDKAEKEISSLREENARLKAHNETLLAAHAVLQQEKGNAVLEGLAARDQIGAERDICVEALEDIQTHCNDFSPIARIAAIKARETLAQLPHAGERARLVEAVLKAARECSDPESFTTMRGALIALDVFDKERR